MEPFTGNHWWPLAPALLTTVALVAAAIGLAGRRDVGDGLLEARDVAAPRSVGLRSAIGLAGRLQLPVLVGWFVGVVASALVLGFVAQLTTADPPASMSDMLDRFGARGSFARQYMGVAFLLIATVVALIPAGQLGAAADEETSGRLVHVLAGPVRRSRWLFGRLLLTAVAVIASASAAGVVAWAAARAQGVDLDLPAMVGAGINVVPVALVCLGIGAVVFAVRPRLAAPAVYAIVIWSLVVDLVGSLVAGVGWLDRLSVFHAMALAPADPLEPLAMVVTTLVGGALCAVAIGLFARRDVRAG
jgi:ABC-2 type transport system permease protein